MQQDVKSDWRPSASTDVLFQRASLLRQIREFFHQREYLEVETPIMGQYGVTDVHLKNIEASFQNTTYYLQTSPEYHMKRLLAAGSGPIFQVFKAFRDDELGKMHNPEFTLLEWYQLGIDHHELIQEVGALLQMVLSCEAIYSMTYQDAFIQSCDVDPFSANIDELQQVLCQHQLGDVLSKDECDKDSYLFLLMSHIVEPWLADIKKPVAIYDFPPSQAVLAKIKNQKAARFEIYYQGVELANGFHELTDADAQIERFKADNHKRAELGYAVKPIDKKLIGALKKGLPDCSGVALGVDRLLALQLQHHNISDLMAFNIHDT